MLCVINRGKSPCIRAPGSTLKAAGVWITRWMSVRQASARAVSGQHIRFSFLQRRNAALFFFYECFALEKVAVSREWSPDIALSPPPLSAIAAVEAMGIKGRHALREAFIFNSGKSDFPSRLFFSCLLTVRSLSCMVLYLQTLPNNGYDLPPFTPPTPRCGVGREGNAQPRLSLFTP